MQEFTIRGYRVLNLAVGLPGNLAYRGPYFGGWRADGIGIFTFAHSRWDRSDQFCIWGTRPLW